LNTAVLFDRKLHFSKFGAALGLADKVSYTL